MDGSDEPGELLERLRLLEEENRRLRAQCAEQGGSPPATDLGEDCITTGADITGIKNAQRQAEEQRAQLEAVLRSLVEGVILFDLQGNVLSMNPAAQRIHELLTAEEIQRNLREYASDYALYSLDDQPLPIEEWPLSRILRGETISGIIVKVRNLRAGSVWYGSYSGTPVRDEAGHIRLGVMTVRDVTASRQAEEEIIQLAGQRQLALDAARLGWWHYDPVTKIATYDQRYTEIFAVTGRQLPNDVILTRLHPDDLPGVWAKVEAALKPTSNPTPYAAEYRINLPDGGTRWVEAHGIATFAGTGNARHAVNLVGTVADITERKQAEEELKRLSEYLEQRVRDRTAQLEAANHELEAFSYSVSHDLRAPLRAIDGFSQAIQEDYADKLDDEGREDLQFIRQGARQMAQLIDDMLRLSRIGRADMRWERVDLSALVNEIAHDLQRQAPDRQVEWLITPELYATGDASLLRILLENLLGNAWKFTGKRPVARVAFFSTQREGETVYAIRDNGAGFAMAYAQKLFAPFQRLHTAEEFPGTGIGLAIVRRIIARHGGRIWAEGTVDQGATFFFTLPDRR